MRAVRRGIRSIVVAYTIFRSRRVMTTRRYPARVGPDPRTLQINDKLGSQRLAGQAGAKRSHLSDAADPIDLGGVARTLRSAPESIHRNSRISITAPPRGRDVPQGTSSCLSETWSCPGSLRHVRRTEPHTSNEGKVLPSDSFLPPEQAQCQAGEIPAREGKPDTVYRKSVIVAARILDDRRST